MLEDRRAHERLDQIEARVLKFELNLKENTDLTRTVADNTTELVQLVKGVKGFRSLVVWAAPVVAAIGAVVAWVKTH